MPNPRLNSPLHMHRRSRRIDPSHPNKRERCDGPEPYYSDEHPSRNKSERTLP
jgi:hypothetical protein